MTKRLLATFAMAIAYFSATHSQEWISAPTQDGSMPVFHKTFHLSKKVKSAVLHSSALGVYTLQINGSEIDYSELKPGWTDYRKEIFLQTMTVPKSLLKGDSLSITAQISNGWWIGGITRGVYGNNNRHAFICDIDVTYTDNTKDRFITDTSWQCATDGSLLLGDIYNGETYDARRKPTHWHNAIINTDNKGVLIPEFGPQVKIRDRKLWKTVANITVYEGSIATGTTYGKINNQQLIGPDGHWIKIFNTYSEKHPTWIRLKRGQTILLDFGQNIVGWIRFTARGNRGTELTWRFGEMLNYNGDAARLDKGPAGSLWTYNLRHAKATLRYIMNGEGNETYHPRYTYFGFRYAELTATDDIDIAANVTGMIVGSDIEEWGTFSCSNPDINQLYSNVWWGQRGNFVSIPTDCPQRDERLGWTGDTQIFSTTALYNSDVKDFYRKWMRDMRNGQRDDGAYPCTAPAANMWGYGGSAWGDAGIIVPWNVYVMTGNTQILTENYESMKRWMKHCAEASEDGWTHIGAETDFGDWLAYKEVEKRYVSYAYFAHTADLMAKISRLLGKNDDTAYYTALHHNIVDEFQRRYITNSEINTGKDTQTAYLLALHFGLLTPKQRPAAIESLRQNIINNGYRLSTGFVGTGILMETLTECGLTDLAYRLLLQRENPSWLYSIDQGATTIWERWDSYTKADGFNKHEWNMNSFNHYSYGAVVQWFYSTILGIRPDESVPGFAHIILAPHFGGGLTWAKGGTMTPHGRIDVEWHHLDNGTYCYTVSIPKGTIATLHLGNRSIEIKGNGKKHKYNVKTN